MVCFFAQWFHLQWNHVIKYIIHTNIEQFYVYARSAKALRNKPGQVDEDLIRAIEGRKLTIKLENGTLQEVDEYRAFWCKKQCYIWDSKRDEFSKLVGLDKHVLCSDLHQGQGLSKEEQLLRYVNTFRWNGYILDIMFAISDSVCYLKFLRDCMLWTQANRLWQQWNIGPSTEHRCSTLIGMHKSVLHIPSFYLGGMVHWRISLLHLCHYRNVFVRNNQFDHPDTEGKLRKFIQSIRHSKTVDKKSLPVWSKIDGLAISIELPILATSIYRRLSWSSYFSRLIQLRNPRLS